MVFIDFFKNKNIRKKFLFTFLILFIYRLGTHITIPNIHPITFGDSTSFFGMMSMLSGGSIEQMSVFALGVGPYITASIVVQLLSTDILPVFKKYQEEGNRGRKKLEKIMRYMAVVIGAIQGFGITYFLSNTYKIVENPGLLTFGYITIIMIAGTMALLWLADQITTKGVGNGVSMIIFTGIVASLPSTFMDAYNTLSTMEFILYILFYIAIIVGVILVQTAERRIPIQQTNRSTYSKGGNANYLPLKVNSANVIPVIFAGMILQLISFVGTILGKEEVIAKFIDLSNPIVMIVYMGVIVLFAFFYVNLQVNPAKVAENLNKNGQYIPSVRPGYDTEKYISKVLNSITWLGGILLALLAVLPYITAKLSGLPVVSSLGGTGVIIVVGVAIEVIASLKSQLVNKKFKGF